MTSSDLCLDAVADADWDALAAGFADFSLLQTRAFGDAKAATGPWRVERCAVRHGDMVIGVAQVLVRTLPAGLGGIAWINRGPLWRRSGETGDTAALGGVLGALRQEFARRRGLYLRIAPATGLSTVSEGFASAECAGWASAVVDLASEPDALRAALKQKWRNVLNKAERGGVAVEEGDALDLFETFRTHYAAWLAERGFTTSVTPELLGALHGGIGLRVFLVCDGGAIAGTALIARYGDTAEYLAGTTTDEGRRLGVGQSLLWRAMLWARTAGLRRFDVGGMDPDLTPQGIFRFKEGLGGTPYRLAEEIEALPGCGPRRLAALLVRRRVRAARREG